MQLGGSGELMGMVARAMYVHVRTAGVRDPIGRGGCITKYIPTNTSPIHDLKSSAMVKTLKFSCMYDTSSSKLRREVMKHILWTAKIRLPNHILLYHVYYTNLKHN